FHLKSSFYNLLWRDPSIVLSFIDRLESRALFQALHLLVRSSSAERVGIRSLHATKTLSLLISRCDLRKKTDRMIVSMLVSIAEERVRQRLEGLHYGDDIKKRLAGIDRTS